MKKCRCIDHTSRETIAILTQKEMKEVLGFTSDSYYFEESRWFFYHDSIEEDGHIRPCIHKLKKYLLLKELKNEVEK